MCQRFERKKEKKTCTGKIGLIDVIPEDTLMSYEAKLCKNMNLNYSIITLIHSLSKQF